MRISRVVCALVLGLGLVGCGGGSSDGETAPDASSAAPGADADPGSPDARTEPGVDADPSLGGGTLAGNVTRSAAPAAGGRGNLYIAVFTADPVTDRDSAVNVANALIEDADMSAADASIPYMVTGVPPRAEPYFVSAFLDDNGTVSGDDPASAGPDRGDLVALDGLQSPKVTVSSESTVGLDIDLNFNLPF